MPVLGNGTPGRSSPVIPDIAAAVAGSAQLSLHLVQVAETRWVCSRPLFHALLWQLLLADVCGFDMRDRSRRYATHITMNFSPAQLSSRSP